MVLGFLDVYSMFVPEFCVRMLRGQSQVVEAKQKCKAIAIFEAKDRQPCNTTMTWVKVCYRVDENSRPSSSKQIPARPAKS